MAVKVNRIQKMIKKSGLVPAGVYKAEGFFKAYDVYMNGESLMKCEGCSIKQAHKEALERFGLKYIEEED